MNIIDEQAKEFNDVLFGDYSLEIEQYKERLENKLNVFKRNKDKLDFLKALISETRNNVLEHEKSCQKPNCEYGKDKYLAIFLMEQEIDCIMEADTLVPSPEDKFSAEEVAKLNEKLNEILKSINKQGLGQEILFDEIKSLKSHFILGKKTWKQLALGKFINVISDKVIEESIAKEIYCQISDMVDDGLKLLN